MTSTELQKSLEQSLKRQLSASASPEYGLIWSSWDMPSGPPICRLRASARRTSGSGFGGWPTPKGQEDGRTLEQYEAGRKRGYEKRKGKTAGGPSSKLGGLAIAAQMAGWATPQTHDAQGPKTPEQVAKMRAKGAGVVNLNEQATLAGWSSPMAGTPAQKGYNEAGNTDSSRKTVGLLAGWVSPTAEDGRRGNLPARPHDTGVPLSQQAALAGWATPTARDMRSEHGSPAMMKRRSDRPQGKPLSKQVLGMPTTSSPVPTEKRGALNPAHSRWLMGFPPEWDACAPTATPSSRRSRRSS